MIIPRNLPYLKTKFVFIDLELLYIFISVIDVEELGPGDKACEELTGKFAHQLQASATFGGWHDSMQKVWRSVNFIQYTHQNTSIPKYSSMYKDMTVYTILHVILILYLFICKLEDFALNYRKRILR